MISPIGSLREWVSILKRSTTSDTQGGRAVSWVDLVTDSTTTYSRFPAAVTPQGGSERLQASTAIGADQAYRVEMRYRADVAPTMRVIWTPFKSASAKTLEVRAVQAKGGARDAIVLDCSEVI